MVFDQDTVELIVQSFIFGNCCVEVVGFLGNVINNALTLQAITETKQAHIFSYFDCQSKKSLLKRTIHHEQTERSVISMVNLSSACVCH